MHRAFELAGDGQRFLYEGGDGWFDLAVSLHTLEHVPDDRRGYYTSFLQTTASLGFFLSMGVIGTTRLVWGETAFQSGGGQGVLAVAGWRIPFRKK